MFSADDPYPEIASLRRRGGVVPYRSRGGTESYFVTRHVDVAAVLGDASTYSTSFLSDALAPMVGDTALVGLEGDRHRSHRLLLASALASSSARTMQRSILRGVTDELVAAVAGDGSGDLIADLALPFPGRVLAVILGLSESESFDLQTWSVELLMNARAGTPDDSLQTALTETLVPAIEDARQRPGEGVLSQLARADVAGDRLSDEVICTLVGFLLVAGLETFHRAIGNLLFALLAHPDQLEVVRADASLRSPAVEEALRWEPPVILTIRNAAADSVLAGAEVPAGSLLYLLLGSANRDERQHRHPDRFDLLREQKPHLAFGRGPHACPGAALSRMALAMLLDGLLEHTAQIELDRAAETPVIRGELFRSPESLPVICRTARS